VGWTGALVYGSTEGAAITIQMLEYANTQLLEFPSLRQLAHATSRRPYIARLERRSGVVGRLAGFSREAARLNTIRLDVMELTEKVDNAIKFFERYVFMRRLYGLAAAQSGSARL